VVWYSFNDRFALKKDCKDICDLEDYLRSKEKIDKESNRNNGKELEQDAIIWNIRTSAAELLRVKLYGLLHSFTFLISLHIPYSLLL